MENYKTITVDEVEKNWTYAGLDYLAGILNGSYALDEARKDILSFRSCKECGQDPCECDD